MKIKLLFLFLFLFPLQAFAWNAMGHRVIAQIAYDHLTPKAKARANQLIGYLANAYPYSSNFQTAAVWADSLRNDDVNAFNSWHFYDEGVSFDGTPVQPTPTPNLVWAVNQCLIVLKSPNSNQFEKAFFLRFLMHLTGDATQPLHCADLYSKQFPHGDHGGNLFPIINSQFQDLHPFWDDGLGLLSHNCQGYPYKSAQANCIANEIQTRYPESYFGANAQDFNPQDWVNQSHALAVNFAYKIQPNTAPSPAYIKQGQAIAEQQLAIAGYRLANLLNQLFT